MMHRIRSISIKNTSLDILGFIFVIALCLGFATLVAHAQSTQTPGFVPLANAQGSVLQTVYNSQGLSAYLNALFTLAISIGAILAVFRIVYAGYMYMGSADMWGNKQQAKSILGDAVLGLLILLAIYLILYQINPNILNLNAFRDVTQVTASPSAPASPTGTQGAPAPTPESLIPPGCVSGGDGANCPIASSEQVIEGTAYCCPATPPT